MLQVKITKEKIVKDFVNKCSCLSLNNAQSTCTFRFGKKSCDTSPRPLKVIFQ